MGGNQAKFGAVMAIVISAVMAAVFYGPGIGSSQRTSSRKSKVAPGVASSSKSSKPSADTINAAALAQRIKPRKIDINSADETQLMKLPGIGRTLARRIVNYRRKHGRFRRPEDLIKVRGIGRKKLQKIRPMITVQ